MDISCIIRKYQYSTVQQKYYVSHIYNLKLLAILKHKKKQVRLILIIYNLVQYI